KTCVSSELAAECAAVTGRAAKKCNARNRGKVRVACRRTVITACQDDPDRSRCLPPPVTTTTTTTIATTTTTTTTTRPTSPHSSIAFDSQPGDYIGGGLHFTLTPADGTFTAAGNFQNGVNITFQGGDESWSLDFSVPHGGGLIPGPYEGAQRFPFNSP